MPLSRRLPKGSSDARPNHSKCFRALRENPFSSVGNGLLPEQPIKVHVSASIYYSLFSLLFSSAKSAWPSANPYHRSNRSDKENAERLQIDPIKDQAFSHAIARIDGKHEHKAKSNRRQPLVLSPIIVFPDQKRQNDRGGREHNPLGSTCLCFRNTSRGKNAMTP